MICRCEVGSSWFFIPKKFKGCAMPSRKNIRFSSHFEKVVDFWKKSTSDFSWIAKRCFFLHPLCFRLKWVKSGEKRNFFKIFFFVFLTHDDSECTFASWQHYQCCWPLKREETLFLLHLPKFRFFFAFLYKILLVQPYARSYFGSSKPSILRLLLDNFTLTHVSCKFLEIFRIVFWKCHIPFGLLSKHRSCSYHII